MGQILIYGDKEKYIRELLTGAELIAGPMGKPVAVIVINDYSMAENLSQLGAEVHFIENAAIVPADTAATASALKQAAEKLGSDIILLASDRRGKELAGRLAQSLGAGCLTDVFALNINSIEIQGQRDALGGAAIATRSIVSDKKVIAIAPGTFEPAVSNAKGSIRKMEVTVTPTLKLIETKTKAEDSIDLEPAEVIVAVGQGLSGPEALPSVEALAEAIGGVVACSKPIATDRKWLAEDRVIGLSGKKCKPALAILLGISGQVQFTVGIRDARTIVAVNTDENAYALHMCDYAYIGDLHQFVEQFKNSL
jgi:electron transfer flavoprotein alpha subunit